MTTTNRAQPAWLQPSNQSGSDLPKLYIYNSLTREKSLFVPLNHQHVTWYACGPTVYDDAHLGHARTYVTSDIIRRIMQDYFGYKVRFVMNITDVDDKIILRARQRYLLDKYKSQFRRSDGSLRAALTFYVTKNLKMPVADENPAAILDKLSLTFADLMNRDGGDDTEVKTKMHVKAALAAAQDIKSLETKPLGTEIAGFELPASLDDILMPYLDNEKVSDIHPKNHEIFTRLTKMHEERFTADMRALNVLDPDDITRVTEYIPQVVEFVERIQRNGFAYQTSKGVYFDVAAFEEANHHYARLEPGNRNNAALQADGEGAITGNESKGDPEKRSQADFALWKLSKPGEPSWQSPWGDGRPGWHIECSAMAFDKLGSQMDIHSGGIDLAFPHHDNELAQSEAYWADRTLGHQHQWVNYFMHMGHLSIAGAKMSKSLKNFTTIRDALSRDNWTSRRLRILLLLGGSWKDRIEMTRDLDKESQSWEERLNNFFIDAKDALDNGNQLAGLLLNDEKMQTTSPFTTADAAMGGLSQVLREAPDIPLEKLFNDIKEKTHNSLLQSFNTRAVLNHMLELIGEWNVAGSQTPTVTTLKIARWLTSMVNMFGLNGTRTPQDSSIGWSGIDVPENAKPALTAISMLRDTLRAKALARTVSHADVNSAIAASRQQFPIQDMHQPFVDVLTEFWASLESIRTESALAPRLLQISDHIRNEQLFHRGISLEDRKDGTPALIRVVTQRMREEQQAKEEKDRQAKKAKEKREDDERKRTKQATVNPEWMFKTSESSKEFSDWDASGFPTKDSAGEPLAKARVKKLMKAWEKQRTIYNEWLKSQNTGSDESASSAEKELIQEIRDRQ